MCTVDSSGIMGSHEQVHVPMSLPGKSELSDKDKEIINFTLDNDVSQTRTFTLLVAVCATLVCKSNNHSDFTLSSMCQVSL